MLIQIPHAYFKMIQKVVIVIDISAVLDGTEAIFTVTHKE